MSKQRGNSFNMKPVTANSKLRVPQEGVKLSKCSHLEYLEERNRGLCALASSNSKTIIWDLVLGLIAKYDLWEELRKEYSDPENW